MPRFVVPEKRAESRIKVVPPEMRMSPVVVLSENKVRVFGPVRWKAAEPVMIPEKLRLFASRF